MHASSTRWRPLTPAERAVAIEVLKHGPSSRSEIARRLGMSGGSITRLTKPLIDAGLLVEGSATPHAARQGRPAQPLDIVVDPWHFVGLKITGDTVYGVVTTLRSTVVARAVRRLDSQDPRSVATAAHQLVTTLQDEYPQLAGVGVGLAGEVRDRAVAVNSPFLGWREVPLAKLLEERIGLPVVVENDVAALVEAETWFGAGRGLDRFAVLTIGAGIGYGLVLGGHRVRSLDQCGGVGRYWVLDPSGPLAPDGRRGTADTLLTIPSIRRQLHAATGRKRDWDEILALAADGDPAVVRLLGEAARALGTLLAHIANFALPQKILLAGEGVGLVAATGDTVTNTLAAHRPPDADPVPLETRVSDFHDWARGAAVLAIQVLVLGGTDG